MKLLLVAIIVCLAGFTLAEEAAIPTKEFHDEVARVGYVAPDFTADAVVSNNQFEPFNLRAQKGKWVVLLFYPLDFTFVCPTELVAMAEKVSEFKAINAQIVGISTDSKYTHLAWINTPRKAGGLGSLSFPLVSDITKEVSKKYGALYQESGHTLRALYVIGPDQRVRHITMNDLPVGRSVDEVLRVLKALQHADAHGEVCPANWKPGDATLIADPEKKIEYFAKRFQDIE